MTLVALATLLKPLRGGNATPEKQAAHGGFREALADAKTRGGARRDADADTQGAAGKLTEQLARRIKDAGPSGADWRDAIQNVPFSDKADVSEKDVDPDPQEAATTDEGQPVDPTALAWLAQNAPATKTYDGELSASDAATMNQEAADDASAVETQASASANAKPVEPVSADASTSALVEKADAQAGTEEAASDPRAQTTNAAVARTDPNASAEIAAILETRPVAPKEAKPAAASDETSDRGNTNPDDGDVRVLSTLGDAPADDAQRPQPTSFGSSIAMLNLVTLRGTSSDARTQTEPRKGNPDNIASPALVSTGLPDDDEQMALAKPATSTPPSPADEATGEFAGKVAAERDDELSQAGATDKTPAKANDQQIVMPRLGPTAASVVETLASHPATKVLKLETQTIVDQQTGTSATHSLKIQLRPVELGEIVATLRMNGDTLSVEIATERAEAYDRLSKDSDTIVKALRSLGLQIDQVTIQPPQVATASVKSDGAMSNQTSGGAGQQFGQPGASAGGGSEGQRGTASQGDERHGRQSAQKGSAMDESARTGGLFI
jgi:chemotaxis protein MotD